MVIKLINTEKEIWKGSVINNVHLLELKQSLGIENTS